MQADVTYFCGLVVLCGTYFHPHALRLSALNSNLAATVSEENMVLGPMLGFHARP